jgi:hypothetical protein
MGSEGVNAMKVSIEKVFATRQLIIWLASKAKVFIINGLPGAGQVLWLGFPMDRALSSKKSLQHPFI